MSNEYNFRLKLARLTSLCMALVVRTAALKLRSVYLGWSTIPSTGGHGIGIIQNLQAYVQLQVPKRSVPMAELDQVDDSNLMVLDVFCNGVYRLVPLCYKSGCQYTDGDDSEEH